MSAPSSSSSAVPAAAAPPSAPLLSGAGARAQDSAAADASSSGAAHNSAAAAPPSSHMQLADDDAVAASASSSSLFDSQPLHSSDSGAVLSSLLDSSLPPLHLMDDGAPAGADDSFAGFEAVPSGTNDEHTMASQGTDLAADSHAHSTAAAASQPQQSSSQQQQQPVSLFGSPVLHPMMMPHPPASPFARAAAGLGLGDDSGLLPSLSLDEQAQLGSPQQLQHSPDEQMGAATAAFPHATPLQLQSPLFGGGSAMPAALAHSSHPFQLPAGAAAHPAAAAAASSSSRAARPRDTSSQLDEDDDEETDANDQRGRKKARRSVTHPAAASSSSAAAAAATFEHGEDEPSSEEDEREAYEDETDESSESDDGDEVYEPPLVRAAPAAAASSASASAVPPRPRPETVDLLDDGGFDAAANDAPLSLFSNDDEMAPLPPDSIIDLTDDNSTFAAAAPNSGAKPQQPAQRGSSIFNPAVSNSYSAAAAANAQTAAVPAVPAAAAAPNYLNRPQSIASSLFGKSSLPPSTFNPFANGGASAGKPTVPGLAPAGLTSSSSSVHAPTPAPKKSVDLRSNSDDDSESDNKLGTILCLVFGTNMCPGKAAVKETVILQRIHTGADSNAIRVDNIIQQPVGVLNKDTAAAIAPLIDNKLVRVEAKVSVLVSEVGLRIELYGQNKDRKAVERHLRKFPQVSYLSVLDPPKKAAATAAASSGDPSHPAGSSAAAASGGATHVNEFGQVVPGHAPSGTGMSVREIENDLDALFGAEIDLALMPLAETPSCLRTQLHPYQRQGLAWCIQHEEKRVMNVDGKNELMMGWSKQTNAQGQVSYYNKLTKESQTEPPELARGGLLADEMGLGKTLQILALVASSLKSNVAPDGTAMSGSNKLTLSLKRGSLATHKRQAPTLIVCPLSVVSNWCSQVLHHFHPAQCLTHYTYHGPNRLRDVHQLMQYDLIITTYNILSQEYEVSQAALGLTGNDAADSESDDDDDAFKTLRKKKKSKATVKKKGLSAGAIAAAAALAAATEQEAEAGGPVSSKPKAAPLFEIEFFRIILDEAHVIRERTTSQSKAARALKGERRWALSGTPLVNRVSDAFALLNFIKVPPFSSHTMWQRIIEKPLKNRDPKGMERLQQVMSTICLRRKKNEEINGKRILLLPEKRQRIREIVLTGKEKALYDTLAESGRSQFNRLLQSDSVLKHYAFVLEILLRMRQACDHSMLVPSHYHSGFTGVGSSDNKAELHRLVSLLEDSMADECAMCHKVCEEAVITQCCHFFCSRCIESYTEQPAYHNAIYAANLAQAQGQAPPPTTHADSRLYCPAINCHSPLDKNLIIGMRHRELLRLEEEQKQAALLHAQGHVTLSPKLLALLEELQLVLNANDKAIVFSQWTSFLDILQACLVQANVKHVRLDGQMSAANRAKALKSFEDDSSVKVFLISLKAGGVGLNLVSANHVFMMDPWWNPSTEDQAVDRVHRLGQVKDVEVVRFICRDSVEEKIMELQNAKREMTTTALTRASKSREDQQADRLQDLLRLFN